MGVHITYYVHGTTTDNENNIATGNNHGELSTVGIKQAKDLNVLVKDIRFNAVFCSDLIRAVDTAERAFGELYNVIKDERLREINYGDYNGKPNTFKNSLTDYIDEPFPNGESYKDVEERLREFLVEISKKCDEKKIALVAHQAPQLALEVICNEKSWEDAIAEDWRKVGRWQPGWEYEYTFYKVIISHNFYGRTTTRRE